MLPKPSPHGLWRRIHRPLTLLAFGGAIIAAAWAIVTPTNCTFGVMRPRVSRVKADHRAIATALASYHADHGFFPAPKPLRPIAPAPGLLEAAGGSSLQTIDPAADLQVEARGRGADGTDRFALPADPFSGVWKEPFLGFGEDRLVDPWPYAYYRAPEPGSGWLLWSPGPDGVYDIRDAARLYSPDRRVPSDELIDATYDPTNGTRSRGDVWRVEG